MQIRKATPDDVKTFLKFKEYFPMPKGKDTSPNGFLMGSSETAYHHFVQHDIVQVLENEEGELVGYSIVLCDETLRNSMVWNKRKDVHWESNRLTELEAQRVCFFEQLVVLPDRNYRCYGKNLGIKSLAEAFKNHAYAITTVVSAPVRNLASRGFVLAAGFHHIGEIVENYPGMPNVSSDFFVMSKIDFELQMKGPYKSLAQKSLGC